MSKRESLARLHESIAKVWEPSSTDVRQNACGHYNTVLPTFTDAEREGYPPKQVKQVTVSCPDCGSRIICFSGLD